MKILFLDNLYLDVITRIGHLDEPTSGEKYIDLNENLNFQKFAAASMLSLELNKIGHESSVIFSNSRKAQLAWILENEGKYKSFSRLAWKRWQLISRIPFFGTFIYNRTLPVRIFMKQIETQKPDYLYCVNINILNRRLISKIQSLGIVVVGQIASPLPPSRFFMNYDHIFSAHPGMVATFQKLGVSSSWLALAFDRSHFDKISKSGWPERTRDVTFAGTFGRHQKTTGPLMKAIAKEVPGLEIYTFASPSRMRRMGLEKNYKGPAWGPEMHKIIAESKVVINRHGKVADGFAVNYRLFEGTGMGALVVTEEAKNMSDLFEAGKEIITYSNIEDAVKKVKRALEETSTLAEIAKRGQAKTLNSHTFHNRANQIAQTLIQMKTH